MATTMNSTLLACTYSLLGASDSPPKLVVPPSFTPVTSSSSSFKLPVIRVQRAQAAAAREDAQRAGRRAALVGLAAALLASATTTSSANASVFDAYLEKSQANKELNDKKRAATTNANFARAYTVQFGTCQFPENFTGCHDLAKHKKVPFLSDDLEIECEGKDKYKCGSNVFWKWSK